MGLGTRITRSEKSRSNLGGGNPGQALTRVGPTCIEANSVWQSIRGIDRHKKARAFVVYDDQAGHQRPADLAHSGALSRLLEVIVWLTMEKIFTHYGDVGVRHLEAECIDSQWRWSVVDTTIKSTIATGRSESLEQAKALAEAAAGGKPMNWRCVTKDPRKKARAEIRGHF